MAADLKIIISARDDAKRVLAGITHNLNTAAQSFQNAGMVMSMGITAPVLGAIGMVTKLAMAAVESENLFTVSMKGMADSTRKWSDDLSKSLGLNAYEVRKNVGTFNVMFRSMDLGEKAAVDMAQGLTQLAYDLGSFYNLPTEQAFQKLRSGIMGESEPLKALGIVVNETTVKQWAMTNGLIRQGEELSEAQKVMARYQVIMEKTSDAQGDLARTADSPTNALRRMQSQLQAVAITAGQEFLPAVSTALSWINNTGMPAVTASMGAFKASWSEMSSEAKKQLVVVIGLMIAGGPLLLALSYAFKAIVGLSAAFKTMRIAAVAEIAFASAATYALGYTIRMLATEGRLVSAAESWAAGVKWVGDVAGYAFDGITKLVGGVTTLDDVLGPAGAAAKAAFDEISKGPVYGPKLPPTVTPIAKINPQEWAALAQGGKAGAEGADSAGAAMEDAAKAAQALAEKVARLTAQFRQIIAPTSDVVDAIIRMDPAVMAAAASIDILKLRLLGLQDQQEAMSESIRAAQDVLSKMQERVSQLSEALSDAKARLSDLANVKLTGMGAAGDKIFWIEQQIKRLKLEALGMSTAGFAPLTAAGKAFTGTLPKTIAELEKLLEIMGLQGSLRWDEQMRMIAAAAGQANKEMSFADAMRAIASTKGEIAGLTGELNMAQAATKMQEQYIRGLEDASRVLSKQIQQVQADLTLEESKFQDNIEKMKDVILKVIELGDESILQAGIMDEATQKMVLLFNEFIKTETDKAIAMFWAAAAAQRDAMSSIANNMGGGGGGIPPAEPPPSPETSAASSSSWGSGNGGGQQNNITIHVAGSVISERELAEVVRAQLLKTGKRNISAGLA